MKKEDLFEAISAVQDRYLTEAEGKRLPWKRMAAAAACLCLVAGGLLLYPFEPPAPAPAPAPGGGQPVKGGPPVAPEMGLDMIIQSIATVPAGVDKADVADAALTHLEPEEVLAHPMAAHLPAAIPEGLVLRYGSLYETVMKDGTTYHLFRVYFQPPAKPAPENQDPNQPIEPTPLDHELMVSVWDFRPDSSQEIYPAGDAFVTLNTLDVSEADLQAVIASLK